MSAVISFYLYVCCHLIFICYVCCHLIFISMSAVISLNIYLIWELEVWWTSVCCRLIFISMSVFVSFLSLCLLSSYFYPYVCCHLFKYLPHLGIGSPVDFGIGSNEVQQVNPANDTPRVSRASSLVHPTSPPGLMLYLWKNYKPPRVLEKLNKITQI